MKKFFLILIIVSLSSFMLGKYSAKFENFVVYKDVTVMLPDDLREVVLSAMPWLKNAAGLTIGALEIYVPNDGKKTKGTSPEYLIFNKEYGYSLFLTKDSIGANLSVDDGDLNTFIISDDKGDKSFSSISYEYLDKHGKVLGNIHDLNRDGQFDVNSVWNRDDGYTEIWVENGWYKPKAKNNQSGVLIEDEWRPVILELGAYRFMEINSNKPIHSTSK